LITPPFWTVAKSASTGEGKSIARFILTPPPASGAREADFILTLSDSQGMRRGELYIHAPLAP